MGDPGAIIVGGYVNGLGIVRALAARNVRTAVITTKPYDIAHRSRYATTHGAAPDVEETPEQLVELLERLAPEWRGSAVFPTNDGALAALAEHHERLSSTYRVIAPSREIAREFLDKQRMLAVARAIGLDVPHCYGAAVPATAALGDLRFPVVVKPTVGHRFFARFGCKLFAAADRTELDRCVASFAQAGLQGQIFDLVPGADREIFAYCTYIDARGEPQGGVTVRKLRQSPPFFGVARVAEIAEHDAQLREATIEFVRHTGFRGMAAAEFKRDPRDGRFRFLEINGRSVIYNSLLRRAGLDVSGLAWSEHVSGRPEPSPANDWRGAWIHLHADVLYSLFYRRHDPIPFAEFSAPYRGPKIFAVWSAQDSLPFVTQWSRTARMGLSALARGTHRELVGERSPLRRPAP